MTKKERRTKKVCMFVGIDDQLKVKGMFVCRSLVDEVAGGRKLTSWWRSRNVEVERMNKT